MSRRRPLAVTLTAGVLASVMTLTLGILPGSLAAPASGAPNPIVTVTFPASVDTYVSKSRPTRSFGSDSRLIANAHADWQKMMLVGFDVNGLPSGAITSTELVLTRDEVPFKDILVSPTTAPWSESTTWSNRPGFGPTIGHAEPTRDALTASVPMQVGSSLEGFQGFAIRTSSTIAMRAFTRESGSAGPKLQVTVDTSVPAESGCSSSATFDSALVPSCGQLWGAVANAFSNRPGWPQQGPEAHRRYESETGRKVGVYSHYYSGAALFPRASEIPFLRESGRERVLFAHWKIASDMTFADVATGKADYRIDRLANHLKENFPEKLFVSLQSEMEPQVNPKAGSGRTAKDYAAMYRHVVDRMKSRGAANVVWVLSYGGYPKWSTQPWFSDLYPGDAYVDWIGWHPYTTTFASGQDFKGLMNTTYDSLDPSFAGMYNYLTKRHPGKPLMLSEFGVFHTPGATGAVLSRKAAFYDSTAQQLHQFPAIKAIVNFDTDYDEHKGNGFDISVFSDPTNLAAFKRLSQNSTLVNPEPQVGSVQR